MAEQTVFRGGLPYAPDVNRLKEIFPVPGLTEGRIISHEDLEAALGYKRGTQRYYGVINSFCSFHKQQFAIVIEWEAGKGIKVLTPHEKLQAVEQKSRQKARQFSRAARELRWVPRERLDEVGQKRYDHDALYLTRAAQSLSGEMKSLPCDLAPVKSLPKPRLLKTG